MENFEIKVDPLDIMERLVKETGEESEDVKRDLIDALYDVMAMAQNPHNKDYWRTLYRVLEKFTEKMQMKEWEENLI